ncbi:MAG TPA: PQQ-binding-like beta-propeller repeat protein [Blastocatellia bacterium]|nr:PQQ-binding-like beta-propeller repeat protein [Blastocatellia bacterium]
MSCIGAQQAGRFSRCVLALCSLLFLAATSTSAYSGDPIWSTKLDEDLRFYQTTEMGVLIAGTEKSLYALDSETGDVLWRRRNVRVDQTDLAPVVGTDLLLLSYEKSGGTQMEAVDIMTGNPIWKSDKVKGSIMHLAVDQEYELLALVLVRDTKGRIREGFKRRPTIHVLSLAEGNELWKRELGSEVEMTPSRWSRKEDEDTVYTLDNYRPPLFLEGRVYFFYDGVTSLDARTGRERIREQFRVNEKGLALTEADPVWDEQYLYTSGRGRVRAILRATGRIVWEAKDLGLTPELVLAQDMLYVRTGGQFTRLKDGEVVARGPYGVSAIDPISGRVLWRYRGADNGNTNIAMANSSTVIIADRDDLIMIDSQTGKARSRTRHKIERAAFVLINEMGQAVVGGRSEVAGFDLTRLNEAVWRVRHEPPGRGLLRTAIAIAARTAALYFRYGGVATAVVRASGVVASLSTLRWSGLASRVTLPNLTDLATGSGREYIGSQFKLYGAAERVERARRSLRQPQLPNLSPGVSVDIEERLLDRLDPARQLDRIARFLWRRQQLAVLRGEFMYFYNELESGRGLAGVNLNNGRTGRVIKLNDPDYRLTTDEAAGRLFVAKANRLLAYPLTGG